jgi:FkbM family methyltransferase
MSAYLKSGKEFLKWLYKNVPFKKSFFLLLKRIWLPPQQVYQHLYFNGTFTVKVSKAHSFKMTHFGQQIENELFWRGLEGGWEKKSIGLWATLCADANIIFDVGANTGLYSLVAKAVSPHSEVFAFEPVNRVVKRLRVNNALNGFNIQIEEMALSNYDGAGTIYDTEEDHILSVTVNKNLHSSGIKAFPVTISVGQLFTFAQRKKVEKIDLIKVDVETHEVEMLEGMRGLLATFKPVLLIEVLNDEVGARIQSLVENFGYSYFDIDEIDGPRQVVEIKKSSGYNYLLCLAQVARKLGLT